MPAQLVRPIREGTFYALYETIRPRLLPRRHLRFHIGDARVAFGAKFYSVTGGQQGAVNPDVNGDCEVDFSDADQIRMFCTAFLALGWFTAKFSSA